MKYTTKRNSIIAAIIFLAGILLGGKIIIDKNPNILTPKTYNLVSSVIDGDTFKIDNGQKVRLLTINTPEKGECYYQEARQALKDLIENKQVRLEKDISERDQYGRLLRHAILPAAPNSPHFPNYPNSPDLIISQYLVENGYALYVPSPPDNRYRDLIITAKEQAKDNGRGLWAACEWPADELEREAKQEQDAGPPSPDCIIKGNISERGYGKTYLIPGCDNYNNVKIDTRKGEQYFCSEQQAIDAGFRKATNCP